MTIELPRLHRSTQYAPRPVYSASEPLRAAYGAPGPPIDRPGDHWSIEVAAAALSEACGGELMADLVRGRGELVAIRLPQNGDAGAIGQPRVELSGQTGSIIRLKGLLPSAVVRKGWFLSIVTAGRRYTFLATDTRIADAASKMSLPVWPMIRAAHLANDVVEIAEPWLEGAIIDGGGYARGGLPVVRPDTFQIEEAP